MKIELEAEDIIQAFNKLTKDEKQVVANAIKADECISNAVNEHLHEICESRERIIRKRELIIQEYIDKYGELDR